jgi:hypothetical protein
MSALSSRRMCAGSWASWPACALLAIVPALGAAGPAHVHGVAELHVVVDGATLEARLRSPLDNLLAFERAPRTEAERAAVRALGARLRQPQTLLVPSPAARCRSDAVAIESAVLPAELLGSPQPVPAPGAAATDGHADLEATFRWRCELPAELGGMDVGLTQAFPGLRTLKVQIVGPRGQSAATLSGTNRKLRW